MNSLSLIMKFTLVFFILIQATIWCKEDYETTDKICSTCKCLKLDASIYIVDGLDPTNLTEYYELDCTKKNLKHLHVGWPEEVGSDQKGVEIIYIMSYNELKTLQQFPATKAVIVFKCQHCQITQIQPEIFIDTPNIVKLDLSWNKISSDELRADIFKGRYNEHEYETLRLETLDLSHNQINSLEKNFFEHTPGIRMLHLSFNPIREIDEATALAIGSLQKLEILDLAHSEILELPEIMFQNMKHLTEIFLDGNKFMKLPQTLALVGKSLQSLYFNDNPVEKFTDDAFLGLEKVLQLNISGMELLTEIKDGVFKNLPALEILFCHSNKKLSLFAMKDLRGLQHLKELDLSFNALKTLDFGYLFPKDAELIKKNESAKLLSDDDKYKNQFKKLTALRLEGNPFHCDCILLHGLSMFDHNSTIFKKNRLNDNALCKTPYDLSGKKVYLLSDDYECNKEHRKVPRIPIYEPPHFLRPKSLLITALSIVSCVVLGIIVGFIIVIIKRKMKKSSNNNNAAKVRYTTVRDSVTAYS